MHKLKLTQVARRLLACVLLLLAGSVAPVMAQDAPKTPLTVERADGSLHEFQVELALSNAQRAARPDAPRELGSRRWYVVYFPE